MSDSFAPADECNFHLSGQKKFPDLPAPEALEIDGMLALSVEAAISNLQARESLAFGSTRAHFNSRSFPAIAA